ncbi:MAG: hypothetical protein GY717_14420, partial [Rhodobacteraceae bacterium]|nr:hypothetical protein [Paracoccaceae bacterium]
LDPGTGERDLRHRAVLGDTLVIYGGEGALTRSTDGGESFASVDPGTERRDLRGHAVLGDTLVIYSRGGALTRSTDGGESFARVDPGTGTRGLLGHAVLGDTLVIYGWGGALLALDDRQARAVAGLAATATTGDAELFEFLDTRQDHLKDNKEIRAIREALLDIRARRDTLLTLVAETQATRDELDSGLTARLLRQEARLSFQGFMSACHGNALSGENGDAVDKVTLACLEGWKAQQGSQAETWWTTLAEQVPPGVLLLFLLATLGGLYRYNLRLAGFHASRADVLELMQMSGGFDAGVLSQISDAMAADKVEFGKGNTPSDQAVAIARAVMARKD